MTLAQKRLLVIGAVICLAALAWRFSPIPPEELLRRAQALRDFPGAVLWVPAAYVLLGLVLFPFVALRVGTILVFGPVVGAVYALAGAAASALVGHALGQRLGADAVARSLGPRARAIRERFARRGILAVAAARMVPLGPFMLVNAVAGAARIPRRDFLIGTLVGTSPGLIALVVAAAVWPAWLG